jgi:hypothetical protein
LGAGLFYVRGCENFVPDVGRKALEPWNGFTGGGDKVLGGGSTVEGGHGGWVGNL